MKGHNHPPHIIELTDDEHGFLLSTCEVNLELGLNLLSTIADRETQEKLVANIEAFKSIRKKLQAS